MCTDGAPVNVAMYRLVKEKAGEHYKLTLRPAHKILRVLNTYVLNALWVPDGLNTKEVFIGFCNNQIISPHNDSTKKIVSQLEGIKNDVAVTLYVIFDAIKFDVLGVIKTISKVLPEADLLLPSLLFICHCGLQ